MFKRRRIPVELNGTELTAPNTLRLSSDESKRRAMR